MRFDTMQSRSWGRRVALAALVVAPLALAGCNDFLKVDNPGAIQPGELQNPAYIGLMVNGVIGDFQPMIASVAIYDAVFTDEARNHHVYSENIDIDKRVVQPDNGTAAGGVYSPIQATRFLADSVASRLKGLLGDTVTRDSRYARVLAIGGMSYELLAENMCTSPVNLSAPLQPNQLSDSALVRLDKAIAVATAARAAATTNSAKASADSLTWFAEVEAARAALQKGDKARAIAYAQQEIAAAPASWKFLAWFSGNSSRETNPFYYGAADSATAANRWLGLDHTPFDSLSDPRIPTAVKTVMDGTRGGVDVPQSPTAWSTFNSAIDWSKAGAMRVASTLEAQYILNEAQGMTVGGIAFINARRAAGNEAPVSPATEADYQSALRDQRARDLFMDGHRLGDLRRYKDQYSIDLFPSGVYPGSNPVQNYGTETCWPLPISEVLGNPNVPKP